jgi:hypothetical protein
VGVGVGVGVGVLSSSGFGQFNQPQKMQQKMQAVTYFVVG